MEHVQRGFICTDVLRGLWDFFREIEIGCMFGASRQLGRSLVQFILGFVLGLGTRIKPSNTDQQLFNNVTEKTSPDALFLQTGFACTKIISLDSPKSHDPSQGERKCWVSTSYQVPLIDLCNVSTVKVSIGICTRPRSKFNPCTKSQRSAQYHHLTKPCPAAPLLSTHTSRVIRYPRTKLPTHAILFPVRPRFVHSRFVHSRLLEFQYPHLRPTQDSRADVAPHNS